MAAFSMAVTPSFAQTQPEQPKKEEKKEDQEAQRRGDEGRKEAVELRLSPVRFGAASCRGGPCLFATRAR